MGKWPPGRGKEERYGEESGEWAWEGRGGGGNGQKMMCGEEEERTGEEKKRQNAELEKGMENKYDPNFQSVVAPIVTPLTYADE